MNNAIRTAVVPTVTLLLACAFTIGLCVRANAAAGDGRGGWFQIDPNAVSDSPSRKSRP